MSLKLTPPKKKPQSAFKDEVFSKKAKKSPSKVETMVVLSDVHVPENDKAATSVALQIIEDLQPDFCLLNGDILELKSCSMHGGEVDVPKLKKELEVGAEFIESLREAAPDMGIWYNEGNHETRAERLIATNAPALEGIFSIGEFFKSLDVNYLSQWEQPFEYGKFLAVHGHQLGKGFPRYHATRLADTYGIPGYTLLMGHTHKEQVYSKNTIKGNVKSIGLGCMRTLDPTWLRGEKAGWVHQMAVIHFVDEEPFVTLVDIKNGTAVFNGKVYQG